MLFEIQLLLSYNFKKQSIFLGFKFFLFKRCVTEKMKRGINRELDQKWIICDMNFCPKT